jgi:hypothetical protein
MKNYIVSNGNGKDVVGGMAADGRGVQYEDLPEDAQEAIDDGSYEFTRRTAVTSKFMDCFMDYYIRTV